MAKNTIQVLDRAFEILETLARARKPMTLVEVERQTSLSKTTVHRILGSLLEKGYVEKLPDGSYSVGTMMFRTLSYHIDSLELHAEAKPYLDALQKQLRLTVYLGVLDGPFVSVIEKVATDRSDEVFTQVGRRLPTHSSSMGKCLLACLSRNELEGVLCDTRLIAYTPQTIIDKREFLKHLHEVRRQGWALDDEETELDHRCIASPVFDYRGDAMAVVSVSGSKAELPDEELGNIASHVVRTAEMVSKRIGYTGY